MMIMMMMAIMMMIMMMMAIMMMIMMFDHGDDGSDHDNYRVKEVT